MTLLIKNVQIEGANRDLPDITCVFISDNRISAIGNFPNKRADVVIDGQGATLCPGFIDVNTDSDHYLTLFDHPSQQDFLKQGVTTIMGGMCGSSLAPLLYGSLESFRKWGDITHVNVSWHTMGEFFSAMDRRKLGVNFGTLVGHSTVRRAIIGETIRDLTKNELNVMGETVRTALREGAYGLSTGLEYVHAKKTPYSELRTLASIVQEHNGVYATHLRNTEKEIVPAVEEAIRIARETGVKVLISHFVPHRGAEKEYEEALAMINELPHSITLQFDLYPSAYSLVPIYTLLPDWAQNGGIDSMLSNINDEWLRERIKKEMPRFDAGEIIIAQAPGNDFLVGKSLHTIQGMYELKDERDALLKLMLTMKLQGGLLHKNLDLGLILKAIKSPRSLIASNAPSFDLNDRTRRVKSERTTSTFTTFLSLAEREQLMDAKSAIEKITRTPAAMFNLSGRGEIKEGNIADLTCIKDAEIRFTIVGGTLAIHNNEFNGAMNGEILRDIVKHR